MNLGLIITSYNRPDYFRQCLNSIKSADIPEGTTIILIDDASTDQETISLFYNFFIDGLAIIKIRNSINSKISANLLFGFNRAYPIGCDVVMNLDGDAIVKKDFISVLMNLYDLFPQHIITGFHSVNRNQDGSERHPIIFISENYCRKSSVGGINMMMNESIFRKYMEPSLKKVIETKSFNWDALTCIESMKDSRAIICSIPSVVQHIGFDSAMKHNEPPDVALDFVSDKLKLSNVTLVGVTGTQLPEMIKVVNISTKKIDFGAVKILSSQPSNDPRVIKVSPAINSKEAYNEFMMHRLADYVDTDFMLIVQPDGYVVNASSWRDEFLNYDYIGAVWNWYADKKVGNGGFSLRSRKLHEILRDDPIISEIYPEDHVIGRTYRNYLEKYHQIKFAPEELANKFSVENFRVSAPGNKYNGSFGFHGFLTDFNGADVDHIPYLLKGNRVQPAPAIRQQRQLIEVEKKKQPIVFSQYFGLGDILFCVTLANDYIKEGHEVLWPIMAQYLPIQKHFPKIKFVDYQQVKINQERKTIRDNVYGKVIPLRWSDQVLRKSYIEVMRAKYDLLKKDFMRWRELTWVRDTDSEQKLFAYLGLKEGEKYNLINNVFRNDQTGKTKIEVNNGIKNIEMRSIPAFTLLDWGKVIEKATSIHTVSTSLSYLIDVMNTTDDLHQYLRKPDEKDFRMTEYLWKKKYIFHS